MKFGLPALLACWFLNAWTEVTASGTPLFSGASISCNASQKTKFRQTLTRRFCSNSQSQIPTIWCSKNSEIERQLLPYHGNCRAVLPLLWADAFLPVGHPSSDCKVLELSKIAQTSAKCRSAKRSVHLFLLFQNLLPRHWSPAFLPEQNSLLLHPLLHPLWQPGEHVLRGQARALGHRVRSVKTEWFAQVSSTIMAGSPENFTPPQESKTKTSHNYNMSCDTATKLTTQIPYTSFVERFMSR